MVYVVDTHVLLWYFLGSRRLHRELRDRIEKVRRGGGRLIIPTIVLAEALDIAKKRRVVYDFPEMYRLILSESEFEVVGFGTEIFNEAMGIKKVKEIHDRIILATARFYQVGILTKDKIINESGEVKTL